MKNHVWIIDFEGLSHETELKLYRDNNISYKITSRVSDFEEDFQAFGKESAIIVSQVNVKCDRKLISNMQHLKGILTFGMGFNNVDLKAAEEYGVYVCNVPDYCAEEVADHTLALSLNLLRGINTYNNKVKNGKWDPNDTRPLRRISELTIGLLGFGQIAQKVANRFKGFKPRIIAYDKFIEHSVFEAQGVESVSFNALIETSDLLSLHVPLTKETKNLLSEKILRKMKKGTLIINTCRGGVIDEPALNKCLKSGHISGVGLDVLYEEPPKQGHPLINHENSVVTPHAAFYSIEAIREMQEKTANNAIRILNQKRPHNIVNQL